MQNIPTLLLALSILSCVSCASDICPEEGCEAPDDELTPGEETPGGGFRDCAELDPAIRERVEECRNDNPNDDEVVVIHPPPNGHNPGGGGGAGGGGGGGDQTSTAGSSCEPIIIGREPEPTVIVYPCDGDADPTNDNPGCYAALVLAPIGIPGFSCEPPAYDRAESCRACMSLGIDALRSGRGTVGTCPLGEAVANAMSSAWYLHEQEHGSEPGLRDGGELASIAVLGGPLVPCPPDLASLGQTSDARTAGGGASSPDWDDALYADQCAPLCDRAEMGPRGCATGGADTCRRVHYVISAGGAVELREGGAPIEGSGLSVVHTECVEETYGGDAELALCCPDARDPDAALLISGAGSCGRFGALAE